ncbi:unnamed protein product, partial [Vitis vinifera]|uniref:Uncharacterized protein n=1 Tax=Vitis vinifera TaxID=29760 RepID=D7SMR9_VITVI
MRAFLVCFLFISVLLFASCVSARELVQNVGEKVYQTLLQSPITMKAFLVCFLFISVLLFASCVSARELVQNEIMSTDHKVGITARESCGIYRRNCKSKPKKCSGKYKRCAPPGP